MPATSAGTAEQRAPPPRDPPHEPRRPGSPVRGPGSPQGAAGPGRPRAGTPAGGLDQTPRAPSGRAGKGRDPALTTATAAAAASPGADAPTPLARSQNASSRRCRLTVRARPHLPAPAQPCASRPTLLRPRLGAPVPPRSRIPQAPSCQERRPRRPARALRTRARTDSAPPPTRRRLRFRSGHSQPARLQVPKGSARARRRGGPKMGVFLIPGW
jgi:hypothetical protein